MYMQIIKYPWLNLAIKRSLFSWAGIDLSDLIPIWNIIWRIISNIVLKSNYYIHFIAISMILNS